MPQTLDSARFAEAAEVSAQLTQWLFDHALPLWWDLGADHVRGGFHESLHADGSATEAPRRARLHPRQIYAYSVAAQINWDGPVDTIVRHGANYFLQHYSRPDWLFRALVAADGHTIDDSAVLYDQSFALLGLAAAYDELDDLELRDRARELESELHRQLQHPLAGFEESASHTQPLLSNSHMHLLEAALAWMDMDHQLRWQQLAGEIVELALSRFAHSAGLMREFFARDWTPAAGEAGRIVEPGHQFEWAWLLLRWADRSDDRRCRDAALRLIDLAETHGVDRKRGVAINRIRDDGWVLDAAARLWPQTERIKAACIAAEATQDSQRLVAATEAARALLKYLDTPVKGLWRDLMNADGSFADTLVPASSLYHIVVAIAELRHTLARMS